MSRARTQVLRVTKTRLLNRDSLTIVSARWAIAGLVVSILALGLLTALTYRAAVSGALASAGAVVLFALALGVAWASSRPKLKRRS